MLTAKRGRCKSFHVMTATCRLLSCFLQSSSMKCVQRSAAATQSRATAARDDRQSLLPAGPLFSVDHCSMQAVLCFLVKSEVAGSPVG